MKTEWNNSPFLLYDIVIFLHWIIFVWLNDFASVLFCWCVYRICCLTWYISVTWTLFRVLVNNGHVSLFKYSKIVQLLKLHQNLQPLHIIFDTKRLNLHFLGWKVYRKPITNLKTYITNDYIKISLPDAHMHYGHNRNHILFVRRWPGEAWHISHQRAWSEAPQGGMA